MGLEKYLGNIPNDIGADQVKEGFWFGFFFFLKNNEKSLKCFMQGNHLTISIPSNLKCLDKGPRGF